MNQLGSGGLNIYADYYIGRGDLDWSLVCFVPSHCICNPPYAIFDLLFLIPLTVPYDVTKIISHHLSRISITMQDDF